MIDLRQRFRELDDLAAPDMRAQIDRLTRELAEPAHEPFLDAEVRPPMWRGPLLAVGTAVLILAIVAAATLLLRSDRKEVTDSTPPTVTTTVGPTVTTSPSVLTTIVESGLIPRDAGAAEDAGWTVIDLPAMRDFEPLTDGRLVSMDIGWGCRNGAGFATVCNSSGEPVASSDPVADPIELMWSSTDGIEWVSAEIPQFVGKVVYPGTWDKRRSYDGASDLLWAWASPIDEFLPTELWVTGDAITWHQVRGDAYGPAPPDQWFEVLAITRYRDVLFMTAVRAGTARHFVSADRGETFTETELFVDTDDHMAGSWSTDTEMRTLVVTNSGDVTLRKSQDGIDWEQAGVVTGLTPRDAWWVASATDALIASPVRYGCADSIAVSIDGGSSWEAIDVMGALPFAEPPPFRGDQGCRPASRDGWILLESKSEVWVSRNGLDWYSIDGNPDIIEGWPGRGGVVTDEGWAVPPVE